jgi:hypothetical protein
MVRDRIAWRRGHFEWLLCITFIEMYELIQKLGRNTDRRTDRQNGDIINLSFCFNENKPKM